MKPDKALFDPGPAFPVILDKFLGRLDTMSPSPQWK